MKLESLEKLIKIACALTEQYEVYVVGSQSILGKFPNAPEVFLKSQEADFMFIGDDKKADLIDGSIGDLSPFHEDRGYYAQGVNEKTVLLPDGWKDRVVKIQNKFTDLKVGYCLDPNDLAASKLAAHREKDLVFVKNMLKYELVDEKTLRNRVESLPINEQRKKTITQWILRNTDKNEPSGPSV